MFRGLRAQLEKIKRKAERSGLKQKDFSIISNNCWGGFVYQYYDMPYASPFAGLYLFAPDYIKMLRDLKTYLSEKLIFINPMESRYAALADASGELGKYPVGLLGDIEIHFLHYKDPAEAEDKWVRRVKRINYDNLIVKFSDRDGCTENLIAEFAKMDYKRKVCITVKKYDYPSCFQLKDCQEEIPADEWKEFTRRVKLTRFINNLYASRS
ncbi:MAG: DUF1919 domain-containing protein [Terrimonas sp.]|nr:DUF1919 domain-containing protein [Terrimonas sp.]